MEIFSFCFEYNLAWTLGKLVQSNFHRKSFLIASYQTTSEMEITESKKNEKKNSTTFLKIRKFYLKNRREKQSQALNKLLVLSECSLSQQYVAGHQLIWYQNLAKAIVVIRKPRKKSTFSYWKYETVISEKQTKNTINSLKQTFTIFRAFTKAKTRGLTSIDP